MLTKDWMLSVDIEPDLSDFVENAMIPIWEFCKKSACRTKLEAAYPEYANEKMTIIPSEMTVSALRLVFLTLSQASVDKIPDDQGNWYLIGIIAARTDLANDELVYLYARYNREDNPNKPIDRYLRLIAFKNDTGEIIGSFANLACHPTILGPENTAISSDFFGIVRDAIQEQFHFPILISNGAEGDISNRHTRISSDIHEMKRVREKLVALLPLCLDWVPVDDGLIFIKNNFRFETFLQKERMQAMIDHNDHLLQNESNHDKIKLLNASNSVLKAYLSRPTEGQISIEYNILRLGDLILCFLPMELFSRHYLDLKAKLKHELIMIGLSNVSIGYLVDKDAYGETYEGMTSPLPWSEIERFLNQLSVDLTHLDN